MKIKYRITLLFTLVVTFILLLVCSSVYYFSDLTRKNDFRKRLHNRAITTVSWLLHVKGMNNELLKRIDETMVITIQDKSVGIYNTRFQEVYSYTDSNIAPIQADSNILKKALTKGEFDYTVGNREVVVLPYKINGEQYTLVASAYDKDGFEKLSRLLLILSISCIGGILITILSGIIFSASIVSPIKKITSTVREITSQKLSRRIELPGPKDELHQLSKTFNDLLSRLQESFEMQRHFIANASHEISTPLTSISSQLEITLQKGRDANEYKNVISSVYEDVKGLNHLTKSLLELAIASGTDKGIELKLVRIDELILNLPLELNKADKTYHAEMEFEIFPENEENLQVFGSPDLLYSAIRNIVMNACKYGQDHIARLHLSFSSDQIHITVSDNGPGIPEEDRNMIFQPFYRSRSSHDIPGFGLGLPLAMQIITLHKGKLELVSSVEKGTSFIIHFPVASIFNKLP